MQKGRQVEVVVKTLNESIARRVFIMVLALMAGVVCISLATSPAYAAEGGISASGLSAAPGALGVQYNSFTTATTAPTAKPSNSPKRYEVYPTYLFFTIGADSTLINYNMYMEIWPAKKPQQKKTWTFGSYMKTYEITGLKPNTKYKARLYYGLSTSVKGPKSKTVSFRTGPNKKPALKSVKVQAINVKKIKKRHVSPYTGYVYRTIYDIYYTYKIRTTVTFKKAPKSKYIKYIMINGKNLKAKKGKKTYTVTTKKLVRYYNSPRGKKYTASVALYQNKKWKGYSKLWSKNKKIK